MSSRAAAVRIFFTSPDTHTHQPINYTYFCRDVSPLTTTGCSLATGIRVMSYLDLVHAFSMYIMAAWFLWLKINEGRVDSMLKNQLSADETASADEEGTQNAASVDTIAESAESEDGQDTEGTIEQINSLIDFQTYMIPFYVLFGVFLMHYARKGFKAANGDSAACASYLQFRKAILVVACVTGIFATGLLGAVIQIGLAYYFMVVVRSHLNNLVMAQTDVASASVVVLA